MENQKREYAAKMLARYLKSLSKAAGLPWNYENDEDMRYLVELLIDATLTELDNRWRRHNRLGTTKGEQVT